MLSAVEQSWGSRSPYFLHSIYQSNPQPREASCYTLQKLWQLSTSSEGTQSWVYKHAGAHREAGREVLLPSMSYLGSLLLTPWCQISLLLWEGPCMGFSFPDPSFYVGSDCCRLHSSWCWDIYIWWCWDELCTHPTEHSFNEGISFLCLALAFNGF